MKQANAKSKKVESIEADADYSSAMEIKEEAALSCDMMEGLVLGVASTERNKKMADIEHNRYKEQLNEVEAKQKLSDCANVIPPTFALCSGLQNQKLYLLWQIQKIDASKDTLER